MTRRLAGWDYCQRAIYMVTITLADRTREWLGRLTFGENAEAQDAPAKPSSTPVPAPGASRPGSVLGASQLGSVLGRSQLGSVLGRSRPSIEPTPFGQAALDALAEMPRFYHQVELIETQLMPDHIHFIVFVKSPLLKPLGALVRGFKAGAAKRWKACCCVNDGSVSGRSCPVPQWADGFQDTVLLHEGQLESMIAYLRDNPSRLAEKRANPSLFRRVSRLELPLDGGRIVGAFEALGNRHLLERPQAQVQCSRRYFAYRRVAKPGGGTKIAHNAEGEPIVEFETPEYRERRDAALAAGEHGAVVLSPCISDGERQIAREALKRRLPLVALKNMGFSKYEKPVGRYFEACAEGRLLLMAPAAWPHSTVSKPMTRFDATALNRIAQWLAGDSAVDIDYHGMKPANIDSLAEAAVMASRAEGK